MDQEIDDEENLSSQEETCFTREVTEISNKPLSTCRNHAQIFTDSKESKKKSIAVTYDLALSKFPMQTKKKKSLVYGNIFIALYSFHIEMAYFKDLGENMHCICTNQKTFAFGENLLNFKLPGTPYISWHLILRIILSNFL